MQIELRKEFSANDILRLKAEFEERYGSIEKLEQSIALARCTKPFAVDDYFVWKAILEGGKITESTIIAHAEVFNILTAKRVELLEYLQKREPKSIKEIAKELNRDYKNVYDDVSALEEAELVACKKHGRNVYVSSAVSSIIITFQK